MIEWDDPLLQSVAYKWIARKYRHGILPGLDAQKADSMLESKSALSKIVVFVHEAIAKANTKKRKGKVVP